MTSKIVLLKLNCISHCDYGFDCFVAVPLIFGMTQLLVALCGFKFPTIFSCFNTWETFSHVALSGIIWPSLGFGAKYSIYM